MKNFECFLEKINTDTFSAARDIFWENHVDNGGMLYCSLSGPQVSDVGSDNERTFVLFLSGEGLVLPVGYVCLSNKVHQDMIDTEMLEDISFNSSRFWYIRQVAVKKEYQGQGLGVALFKLLFDMYSGVTFYSHVSVRNIPSLKLHYRAGFVKIGVYRNDDFCGSTADYISDLVVYNRVKKS